MLLLKVFVILTINAFFGESYVIYDPNHPPVITAINDSYVYVEYQKSFKNLNFSSVTEVELSQDLPGLETPHVLGIASMGVHETYLLGNTVYQPLPSDENIFIAKMDPCSGSTKLAQFHLTIKYTDNNVLKSAAKTDNGITIKNDNSVLYDFKYHPKKYWKDNLDNFICAETKSIIRLDYKQSDVPQVRSCIKKVEILTGEKIELKNGSNTVNDIQDFIKVQINEKCTFHDIDLAPCIVGDIIRANNDPWICVQDDGTLNITKTKWEQFEILTQEWERISDYTNLPYLDMDLTVKNYDSEKIWSVKYRVKMKYCNPENHIQALSSTHSNDNNLLTIGLSSVGGVFTLIILAVIIIARVRKNSDSIQNNRISKDVNPTYDCNDYEDYYVQSNIVETNEDYGAGGED